MWSVSSTLPHDAGLELEDVKQLMREAIRAHRRERPERERRAASASLAAQARNLLEGVHCVATYAARPTEPATADILHVLHELGIAILLPMLGPGLSRDWARYAPGDALEVRAPGRPPEPAGPGLGPEALAEADLILAPALSVDARGNRLGQGGGWYDRALAHARPHARVFAIVFDDERTDQLPVAAHDRRVDGVLTPSGWTLLAG